MRVVTFELGPEACKGTASIDETDEPSWEGRGVKPCPWCDECDLPVPVLDHLDPG